MSDFNLRFKKNTNTFLGRPLYQVHENIKNIKPRVLRLEFKNIKSQSKLLKKTLVQNQRVLKF